MNEFEEYKILGEPTKKEKIEIWKMAIGLQKIDGLVPSPFFNEIARSNIEGNMTIDNVKRRIYSFYLKKTTANSLEKRTEYADKVSFHVAEILSKNSFSFGLIEYLSIHKRLFETIVNVPEKFEITILLNVNLF